MKTEKLSDYPDSVYNRKRRSCIWHSVKIADSMRGDAVQSAISELSPSARLVHISLLTVQEIAPVSRSVRTAVSIPAENALNGIAVHTR